MKKATFLIAFILCFTATTDAQFLKKLGKKVEQAAEKAVERKVERKTTKETEKAFDSTFNNQRKTKRNKKSTSLIGNSKVDPAASYKFNHRAVMQIQSGKEVIDIDYFLPDTGNYLGAKIKDKKMEGNFYTVFDVDKEAMFTYMENDGQKIKMSMAFNLENDGNTAPNITITATGNSKSILGYSCQEYKMKGEDMTATIWVTKDTELRFPSTFYDIKQNKNNNQTWMKDLDGWAMEVTMVDTSKRKPHTIIMKCLSITSSNLIINSNDYQSLGY